MIDMEEMIKMGQRLALLHLRLELQGSVDDGVLKAAIKRVEEQLHLV